LASTFVALPARNIVGSLAVMQEAQAQRNDLDSIVAAFNEAGGSALEWTFRELAMGLRRRSQSVHHRIGSIRRFCLRRRLAARPIAALPQPNPHFC
jgi:hypothetical protein